MQVFTNRAIRLMLGVMVPYSHLLMLWSPVVALALGTLSDHYGRRPLLLLCTATQCIRSFGAALVVYLRLSLWWFAPFFFVNGLGGASWVFVVLIMAALGELQLTPQSELRYSHM